MRYRINLFPLKEQTLIDKVIYFSLNYLRYILVITQTVIIGVFFYRFKIDQEIVDLKDALNQKQEIVTVSKPLLKQAEAVERTINYVDKTARDQETQRAMLNYFVSRFPESMTVSRMIIEDNNLNVELISKDALIIKLFTDKLNRESRFALVQLRKVQKTEGGYSTNFVLTNFHQSP